MKKFFVLLIIIFPPAMGFSVYILRVRWPSNWLEAFFWFWVAILGWMSLLAALAEMSGYNVKSVLSQLKRRKPKPPQTMEVSNSLTKNVQPSKITIAWHRSNQIDWSTYFSNPWTTLKLLKTIDSRETTVYELQNTLKWNVFLLLDKVEQLFALGLAVAIQEQKVSLTNSGNLLLELFSNRFN
jgi:hypothetical protein